MSLKKWLPIAGLLAISFSSTAQAVTITDGYYGAEPTNSFPDQDVIGPTDIFDTSELRYTLVGSILNIEIDSKYHANVGNGGTQLGDLFISTDGWHPYGTAPYVDDDMTNGEDWELALVLDDHLATSGVAALFSISGLG